jgi:hypothetical protein
LEPVSSSAALNASKEEASDESEKIQQEIVHDEREPILVN